MPENFASILEALAAEGRAAARPKAAASIAALGRSRRRRRSLTMAFSAAAVCAVAVGVVLGGSGTKPVALPAVRQTMPIPAPPSAPSLDDTHRFLKPDEVSNPGAFQWQIHGPFSVPVRPIKTVSFCGKDGTVGAPVLHASTEAVAEYDSSTSGLNSIEYVFSYASESAAAQDFSQFVPDWSACAATSRSGHLTAGVPGGIAWVESRYVSLHFMAVQVGNRLAFWSYTDGQGPAYDQAGDQAALQRMADRLAGRTPVPATDTSAPPGTVPASVALDASQIPFKTADQSADGWVPMSPLPPSQGTAPPTDLCSGGPGGLVDGVGSMANQFMWHGSPKNTPVYQGSTYLYSSAQETVHTFPTASAALSAFTYAKGVQALNGCTFKDANNGGQLVSRTLRAGTATASAFSEQVDDKPSSHAHLYVVVKGTRVAELVVMFLQGDNTTAGDAAVLEAMAARLP